MDDRSAFAIECRGLEHRFGTAKTVQAVSRANPLSYQVDALRTLLLGAPGNLGLDYVILAAAAGLSITTASALLHRLPLEPG